MASDIALTQTAYEAIGNQETTNRLSFLRGLAHLVGLPSLLYLVELLLAVCLGKCKSSRVCSYPPKLRLMAKSWGGCQTVGSRGPVPEELRLPLVFLDYFPLMVTWRVISWRYLLFSISSSWMPLSCIFSSEPECQTLSNAPTKARVMAKFSRQLSRASFQSLERSMSRYDVDNQNLNINYKSEWMQNIHPCTKG